MSPIQRYRPMMSLRCLFSFQINLMQVISRHRDIPSSLSVYLDVVRLGAAVVVLLAHIWPILFPSLPNYWPGHSAVVVFFVLSGFVISHAARPGLGLRTYILHRVARIYPVLVAAAFLSLAIALLVPVNIMGYGSSRGSDWQDIGLNLIFLGQSWMDVPMPYVGTVWSLNYEIWYYVLFGIWCYYPNRLLLICAALVAGPKILLLMPVWLTGVLLHRWMIPLKPLHALCLFLVSALAGLLFLWKGAGIAIRELMRGFAPELIESAQGSNQFVGDFILGVIVALNFLAAASLKHILLLKCRSLIQYLASLTFSLYLFHLPLTVLIWNGLQVRSVVAFLALLLGGVWALGMLTERRTTWYRFLLSRALRSRPSSLGGASISVDSPAIESKSAAN